MHTPTDMPYWMLNIGRHLRRRCHPPRPLPFGVRVRLLDLVRVEGAVGLLKTHPALF